MFRQLKKKGNRTKILIAVIIIGVLVGVNLFAIIPPLTARWIYPTNQSTATVIAAYPKNYVELTTETWTDEGYESIEFILYEDSDPIWGAGHDDLTEVSRAKIHYLGYEDVGGIMVDWGEGFADAQPPWLFDYTRASSADEQFLQDKTVKWKWKAEVKPDTYYFCRFYAKHSSGTFVSGPGVEFTTAYKDYYPVITIITPTSGQTFWNQEINFKIQFDNNAQGIGQAEVSAVSVHLDTIAKSYTFDLTEGPEGTWTTIVDSASIDDGTYTVTYYYESTNLIGVKTVAGGVITIDNTGLPPEIDWAFITAMLTITGIFIVVVIIVAILLRYIIIPTLQARKLWRMK